MRIFVNLYDLKIPLEGCAAIFKSLGLVYGSDYDSISVWSNCVFGIYSDNTESAEMMKYSLKLWKVEAVC